MNTDTYWEDFSIDLEEDIATPLSLKSTSASTSMMNSCFRNKGNVKVQEIQSLFDEINIRIMREKSKTLKFDKSTIRKFVEFSSDKKQLRNLSSFK